MTYYNVIFLRIFSPLSLSQSILSFARIGEYGILPPPFTQPSTSSCNLHGVCDTLRTLLNSNFCHMLYTIATILIVLWLLGVVTSYTVGGFIHVLLVLAIVVILLRVIRGENPLA